MNVFEDKITDGAAEILRYEINKLTSYIMKNYTEDIKLNESAVDVAIKLLKKYKIFSMGWTKNENN